MLLKTIQSTSPERLLPRVRSYWSWTRRGQTSGMQEHQTETSVKMTRRERADHGRGVDRQQSPPHPLSGSERARQNCLIRELSGHDGELWDKLASASAEANAPHPRFSWEKCLRGPRTITHDFALLREFKLRCSHHDTHTHTQITNNERRTTVQTTTSKDITQACQKGHLLMFSEHGTKRPTTRQR